LAGPSFPGPLVAYALARFPSDPNPFEAARLYLALADRPPSGPGWLHEIKFDGYRVIARKDGEQVRLWARTTSDYSCSQPGPDGGLSASAGWQGSMKPGGLERERIGRETRQSIRNQRTGGGRTGPGTGIYANLGGITNRSTGAYSPGMAAWEPPRPLVTQERAAKRR